MHLADNKLLPIPTSVPNSEDETNVYTSRCPTGKPISFNHHVYHVHVLESLKLEFQIFGGGRGREGGKG